jgi:phosphonatase-like hydrolase
LSAALVVFDLGGTTIHDHGEVPASFTTALRETGIPFEPTEIESWRGASKRDVLQRLVDRNQLDPKLVDRTYRIFQESLRTRYSAAPELAFPVAASAFTTLRQHGVRVALNSGFDRAIVKLILGLAEWRLDWFDSIVCAEDVTRGRPAPDMIHRSMEIAGIADAQQVAVVGDTRLDLEAGLAAGAAWRIGVLSGAHDRRTLERAPFTHIVPDVSGVPDILT